MIAKRITSKAKTSRIARLVKYVVAAQGGIDPRSWSRTADYMLASGTSSRGEKVGGVRVTNCNTDDPAAATTLIEATQAANTRSKTDKTYHLVFSFPPGEEPYLKVLHAIEDQLVAAIGYAEHQRISAVHIDTDHLHVHVAINKVHPKGFQNIEPYFDKKKLMEECDRLERKYKLTPTNHGLTGEKKHDKHNAVKLEPQRGIDANTRKQLHKSHVLASAEGSKGKNNYGMPELPGGNVAHIERGYSELLPGDARNRLLNEREKHLDSVRRSGDGAGRTKSRLNEAQANMEAHSGMETLVGYVSREVAPAMRNATSWNELHSVLAAHGLTIKKRGAGLVIGSGETWAKASQIDRSFSLKALTDRLGPFEHKTEKINKPYEAKPLQRHPSSALLFEQYQRDKSRYKAIRTYGLDQARYEGQVLEANLQKWKKAQRALVKLAAKGPQRRAMLKMVTLQTATTRKANWRTTEAKRRKVMSDTAHPSWAIWLSQQAEKGDTEAVDVLRSRGAHSPIQGDILTAANSDTAATVILKRYQLQAGTNGILTYSLSDGGLVIDRKTHVQSFRTTERSILLSLELAGKRYKGQELIVEGQDHFKAEVARLAGIHGFKISFADPALERARKASKPNGKTINNEVEL